MASKNDNEDLHGAAPAGGAAAVEAGGSGLHDGTQEGAGLKAAAAPVELKSTELRGGSPLTGEELMRLSRDGVADQLFGQQRALDAIRLGIGIEAPGYNVFVSGLRTRAERDSILGLLQERAAQMPTPGDWVYVNNFRTPEAPVAIALKAGQGIELQARMKELVGFVIEQLPKAFRRRTSTRSGRHCATSTTRGRRSCTAASRRGRRSGASGSRAGRAGR